MDSIPLTSKVVIHMFFSHIDLSYCLGSLGFHLEELPEYFPFSVSCKLSLSVFLHHELYFIFITKDSFAGYKSLSGCFSIPHNILTMSYHSFLASIFSYWEASSILSVQLYMINWLYLADFKIFSWSIFVILLFGLHNFY